MLFVAYKSLHFVHSFVNAICNIDGLVSFCTVNFSNISVRKKTKEDFVSRGNEINFHNAEYYVPLRIATNFCNTEINDQPFSVITLNVL